MRTTRWTGYLFVATIGLGMAIAQSARPSCAKCAELNRPNAPFRIFGNTCYVGPHGLSSILITSAAGHVLIDGDLPESAQQIAANIRALGFRVEDVKLIVNSHVHFDHAGGIAEVQRLSGARVVASQWSAVVLKEGGPGKGDPQFGILPAIAPVKHVEELREGESLRVGELVITPHLTPGHTPGGTSWTWKSCEGTICHDMVYADSLSPISADGFKYSNPQQYPTAAADFEKSFTFLETVPCDILITAHPEVSSLWDRLEARERGAKPNAMVDPSACRQLAEHARAQFRDRLAQENKQ